MNKQYKLKKWYPSLPYGFEEGDVVKQVADGSKYKIPHVSTYFSISEIEDNPEFWEEVVEKDYEILSIRYTGTNKVVPNILTDKGDIDAYLSGYCNDTWTTHSVKRLSDGEVFTVGDKVLTKGYEILKFIRTGEKLWVSVERLGRNLKFGELCHTKQHLFTTEDGVDIYEGDEYVSVSSHTNHIVLVSNARNPSKTSLKFSTKEKAQEWIDQNKPLFTTEDEVVIYEGDKFWIVTDDFGLISSHGGNTELPRGKRFSTRENAEKWMDQNNPIYSKQDIAKVIYDLDLDNLIEQRLKELNTQHKNKNE